MGVWDLQRQARAASLWAFATAAILVAAVALAAPPPAAASAQRPCGYVGIYVASPLHVFARRTTSCRFARAIVRKGLRHMASTGNDADRFWVAVRSPVTHRRYRVLEVFEPPIDRLYMRFAGRRGSGIRGHATAPLG